MCPFDFCFLKLIYFWYSRCLFKLEAVDIAIWSRLGLLEVGAGDGTRERAIQELKALLVPWNGSPPLSPEDMGALCGILVSDRRHFRRRDRAAF